MSANGFVLKPISPRRILTRTGGYLAAYTHTLNPYVGCSFGCAYCYVRKMPVALFRKETWGSWVDVKRDGAQRLLRELEREKHKGPVTIFMSSATDPYQPAEHRECVTRSLLEVLVQSPPDFLWVQTRSPLVERDADLFLAMKDRVRISVTIETDLKHVQKQLTPGTPPLAARFRALKRLRARGLDVQATVAPILPSSPEFPLRLREAVDRVGLDDLLSGDGSGGRRSESLGMRDKFRENGWEAWYDETVIERLRAQMLRYFRADQVKTGKEAFVAGSSFS